MVLTYFLFFFQLWVGICLYLASFVQLSDQKDMFIKYKDYFKNFYNLPPASEQIFTTISKELQGKMSEKALSISLKRNYSYFFDTEILEDYDSEPRSSYNNSAVDSSQEDEGPTHHKVFN